MMYLYLCLMSMWPAVFELLVVVCVNEKMVVHDGMHDEVISTP